MIVNTTYFIIAESVNSGRFDIIRVFCICKTEGARLVNAAVDRAAVCL